MRLRYQKMSPVFKKWHLRDVPFAASIHHLLAPDSGDPHDHPFGFTSHILKGWYIEEQYDRQTGGVTRLTRNEGSCHRIAAEDVHRIVEVSEGGCYTIIVPSGPYARAPRFWRFGRGGIVSRAWNEAWPA
jgi:hypothetical protein